MESMVMLFAVLGLLASFLLRDWFYKRREKRRQRFLKTGKKR